MGVAVAQEPTWLSSARRTALQRYQSASLPGRSDEAWRRLDLRDFNPDAFHPSTDVVPVSANGVVHDLDRALAEHGELVRPWLELPAEATKLEWLAHAWRNAGVFIRIPRGTQMELPVQTAQVAGGDGTACVPHQIVLVEAGASAVVLNEWRSSDASATTLHCGLTTIIVQPGARLVYAHLQQLGGKSRSFLWQRVHVARGGHCLLFNGEWGGRVARLDVRVTLEGEGARGDLLGLVLGRGDQQLDVHTCQEHATPQATSDLLYKSVLNDRARVAYQGMIRVPKVAQRTDAYQSNRNLLLSPHAKAESIPKLEIEADDVRCTHGATVGHVDEELRFYLQSRGLTVATADRLIVDGFITDVLARVPNDALRAQIQERVAAAQGWGA